MKSLRILLGVAAFLGTSLAPAAAATSATPAADSKKPPSLSDRFEGMQFRFIGPYRGGRSAAVTGVRRQPHVFYFGAAGGGVWKTTDGGSNWEPSRTRTSRPDRSARSPSRNPTRT